MTSGRRSGGGVSGEPLRWIMVRNSSELGRSIGTCWTWLSVHNMIYTQSIAPTPTYPLQKAGRWATGVVQVIFLPPQHLSSLKLRNDGDAGGEGWCRKRSVTLQPQATVSDDKIFREELASLLTASCGNRRRMGSGHPRGVRDVAGLRWQAAEDGNQARLKRALNSVAAASSLLWINFTLPAQGVPEELIPPLKELRNEIVRVGVHIHSYDTQEIFSKLLPKPSLAGTIF